MGVFTALLPAAEVQPPHVLTATEQVASHRSLIVRNVFILLGLFLTALRLVQLRHRMGSAANFKFAT
jgi:hypothetical protein